MVHGGGKPLVNAEELLDILHGMGYEIAADELAVFQRAFENFWENEDERSQNGDSTNSSFFSSLCFSEDDNVLRRGKECGEDCDEFLKKLCNSFGEMSTCSSPTSSSNAQDDLSDFRNDVSDLIYCGYLRLQRMRSTNSYLASLIQKWRAINDGDAAAGYLNHDDEVLETGLVDECDKENVSPDSSVVTVIENPTVSSEAVVRPVLQVKPGGLTFRHDPVKKFELYKKEWESNPPPGEKKRLSLRWKVREFMMRMDVPTVTHNDLQKPREKNPAWNPRSYL